MMIQNLGKTHLFFTVSSLKTTKKTSTGPGSQFLFWGEIFALAKTRKTTLARGDKGENYVL
jgi:hypothetical protein